MYVVHVFLNAEGGFAHGAAGVMMVCAGGSVRGAVYCAVWRETRGCAEHGGVVSADGAEVLRKGGGTLLGRADSGKRKRYNEMWKGTAYYV